MPTRRSGLLAATLCLTAFGPQVHAQAVHLFEGEARSLEDGRVLYTEQHRVEGECRAGGFRPLHHVVDYRSPEGEGIARKELDYGESLARPTFTKTDTRFDESMKVINESDRRARIIWDQPGDEPEQRFEVKLTDRVVIDAGFNQFIQANLPALKGGKRIGFEFLGPTKGDTFAFEAEQIQRPKDLKGDVAIRLRPASMITRWFVDPLFLGYDNQGHLTDYRGLTNIRRDREGNHRAHLRYDHSQLPNCPP